MTARNSQRDPPPAEDPAVWRWLTKQRPAPKKRPAILLALAILYAIWMAVLLVMSL